MIETVGLLSDIFVVEVQCRVVLEEHRIERSSFWEGGREEGSQAKSKQAI